MTSLEGCLHGIRYTSIGDARGLRRTRTTVWRTSTKPTFRMVKRRPSPPRHRVNYFIEIRNRAGQWVMASSVHAGPCRAGRLITSKSWSVILEWGKRPQQGVRHLVDDFDEFEPLRTAAPDEVPGGATFDRPPGAKSGCHSHKPQTGIIGTGTVAERVIASRDDTGAPVLGIRSMIYLALTYDHRLVDGADAARFLATVKNQLETGFTAGELRELRG
ncbi:Dihydrolipoyllysine-residue acetyltransferase component of pyruvate dehydrogenase complex (plasmid) [Mycobacterium sp. THAF192]|nr:Dihydrolipoyllysine-residue acetyltransferase component of pyruvate dehydrogenase complex [Mycobacterium sp. THAF192]